MTWLALSLALAATPVQPASGNPPWRVITTPAVHLGVRPAAFLDDEGDRQTLEWGLGLTVQVSLLDP